MNQELLTTQVGPELDATLGKLAQMLEKSWEEIVKLLLEEVAFAFKDTYEKSGQIWDSVRLEYVHGGRRSLRRLASEGAIDMILNRAQEMSSDSDRQKWVQGLKRSKSRCQTERASLHWNSAGNSEKGNSGEVIYGFHAARLQ